MEKFHVLGLDLRRPGEEGYTPVTLDGMPIRGVTDVKLDAPAHQFATVTLTLVVDVVQGVPPTKLDPTDEMAERMGEAIRQNLMPRLEKLERPVTNGG